MQPARLHARGMHRPALWHNVGRLQGSSREPTHTHPSSPPSALRPCAKLKIPFVPPASQRACGGPRHLLASGGCWNRMFPVAAAECAQSTPHEPLHHTSAPVGSRCGTTFPFLELLHAYTPMYVAPYHFWGCMWLWWAEIGMDAPLRAQTHPIIKLPGSEPISRRPRNERLQ